MKTDEWVSLPFGKNGWFLTLALLGTFVAAAEAQTPPITPAPDGTGTQVTQQGNRFDIDGGSRSGDQTNLFHSFTRFGLSEGQIANFLTNPNIRNILGRVTGGEASLINGLIQVTGGNSNLYLMNPAGIIFGPNASLNIPASFTATTATGIGFGNHWFSAAGNNNWSTLVGTPNAFAFTSLQPGSIVNQGNLAVSSGESLTLMGGSLVNTGQLSAPSGRIILAAVPGENLVRMSQPGHLLSLDIQPVAGQASLPENWTVPAASLPELLTGNGLTHATGVSVNQFGQIVLGGQTIPVASGTNLVSGTLNVAGETGGSAFVLGNQVGLISININASGSNGGGQIFIGGDYRGLGTIPNALRTFVSSDSVLNADAVNTGNGGRVIVWADEITRFAGSISARGGLYSGHGGFVEVSGKEVLQFTGTANTTAPQGNPGLLLLDPRNITITPGGTDAATGQIFSFNPGLDSFISGATLSAAINAGSVTLQANNNINVQDTVTATTPGNGLTLQAGHSIIFNGGIVNLNGGNFIARINDENANPAFRTPPPPQPIFDLGGSSQILTNGGNVTISYGTFGGTPAGSVFIDGLSAINAGTGNISISGILSAPLTSGFGISLESGAQLVTSGAGSITLNGNVGAGGGNTNGIQILDSLTTVSSQDGDITLIGIGGVGGGSANNGVTIAGAVIESTGTGNINITGTGGGAGTFAHNGIYVLGGAQVRTTGTGNIVLNGTGGTGVDNNNGIFIEGDVVPTSVTSANGNITLIGTGGIATGQNNQGIFINNGAFVQSTGLGTITLNGTGGSGGGNNFGILLLNAGTLITSVDGNIQLTGTGGAVTFNSGVGIVIENSAIVRSTGAGSILLTGNSNALPSASNNDGIRIDTSSIVESTGTGNISLTGSGGNGTIANRGLAITGGSTVQATSGDITLTGSGGNGTNSNHGIAITNLSTVQSVGGNVTLTGNGAGTLANNRGLEIDTSTVQSTSGMGNVIINGTGGNGTTFNQGILLFSSTVQSAGGNVTLTGNGAGTLTNNRGLEIDTSTVRSTSGMGNVIINGTGGNGTNSNQGIRLAFSTVQSVGGNVTLTGNGAGTVDGNSGIVVGSSTIQSTGTGNITLSGIGGNGTATQNKGVLLGSSQVNSAGGNIRVTGNAGGTGTISEGIYSDGTTLQTTGVGTIALEGTGALGSGANAGLYLWNPTTVQSENGDITLNGTALGTGGVNYGVYFADGTVETIGTGNIAITGVSTTPADSLVLNGTQINPTLTGTGNVTLTGDEIEFQGATAINGTNTLRLQPLTPSLDITVGGTVVDNRLNLSAAEVALPNGFSQILISASDGSNTIGIDPAGVTFNTPVTLQSPSGVIGVGGPITGTGTASITFDAPTINLGADITTAGQDITFGGQVFVAAGNNLTLNTNATTGNINFFNTVDGDGQLTLSANTITLRSPIGGTTPLTSLTVTTGNITGPNDISITTTNDITLGNITNPGRSITLTSNNGNINTQAGTLDSSSIGGNAGPIALTATGNITTGNLNTSSIGGNAGTLILESTNLTDGSIAVGNINASSTVGVGGELSLSAPFQVSVNGINTTGLPATGNITLKSSEIDFGGQPVQGAGALSLQPYNQNGNIRFGTGLVADPNAIELGSPFVTALQDGFTSILIGRPDGTGSITIENVPVTFQDPVTFQTQTGSIFLNNPLTTTGDGSVTFNAPTTHLSSNIITAEQAITFNGNLIIDNTALVSTSPSAGGDIQVNGTLDGTNNLTLEAGTGNITVVGDIGSTTRLGTLTISSATNLQTGAITATNLQSTVSNSSTFGALNTNGTTGINLTGATFTFNGTATTTNNGAFILNNTAPITLSLNNFNLDGAFNLTGLGAVTLSGSLTTTNDAISFTPPVTLAGETTLNSGTAGIAFQSSLNAATFPLNLTAGKIDFGGAVSGSNTLTLTQAIAGGNISLGGTANLDSNILDLTDTDISNLQNGFSSIKLQASSGGDIEVINPVTFNDPLTLESLTGNITINNTLAGNDNATLTLTALSTTLNQPLQTSDQTITINSNVLVGNNASVSTGLSAGGDIQVNGTIDGTNNLTLEAGTGNITVFGDIGSTTPLGNLTLNQTNNITLGAISAAGILQTAGTGITTFNGPSLTNSATGINLTGNAFTFHSPVTTLNGGGLTVNNSGSLNLINANVNLDNRFQQIGTSGTFLSGSITSNSDIKFNSPVTLRGATALTAQGDLNFANSLDGPTDLTLTTPTGNITFSSSVGSQARLNNLTITQANNVQALGLVNVGNLTQLSGLNTTTFNSPLNANGSNGINLTGTHFNLNNSVATANNAGLTINNSGTLTITPTASVKLDGSFNQIGTGLVTLAGNLSTTNDNISFTGPVTLNAAVNLTPGTATLAFGSSLNLGNYPLTLRAGEIDFNGPVSGTNTLTLQPATAQQSLNLGGDNNTSALDLTTTELNHVQNGLSAIIIGRLDGTGPLTVNGNITFNDPVTLQTGTGRLTVNAPIIGNDNASITLIAPTLNLNADLSTTSNLDLNGSVILGTDLTLNSGGTLRITRTVNGPHRLSLNANSIQLLGEIGTTSPLQSLNIEAGATNLGGNVTTNGAINFNDALILTNNLRLNSGGGNITFGNTVNSQINTSYGLTLAAGEGSIRFNGAVGTNGPLGSAIIETAREIVGTSFLNAQNIEFTSTGPITLLGNLFTRQATINAGQNLTVGNITANGGQIRLTSNTGDLTAGNLDTSAPNAGNISLNSPTGSVVTGHLQAAGVDQGGNITVIAQTAITTGQINSSATVGDAGTVFLDPIGDVQVEWINAQGGSSGRGGNVFVESTGGFLRATGVFSTPNSPTGTASISTAGGAGAGTITLRHAGGDEIAPIQGFEIGNATFNGTAAAVTDGQSSLLPGQAFPRSFRLGNIAVETDGLVPTPTPTPAPSPVPTPISTPTAAPIPVPASSPAPEPTILSSPQATPTPAPVLTSEPEPIPRPATLPLISWPNLPVQTGTSPAPEPPVLESGNKPSTASTSEVITSVTSNTARQGEVVTVTRTSPLTSDSVSAVGSANITELTPSLVGTTSRRLENTLSTPQTPTPDSTSPPPLNLPYSERNPVSPLDDPGFASQERIVSIDSSILDRRPGESIDQTNSSAGTNFVLGYEPSPNQLFEEGNLEGTIWQIEQFRNQEFQEYLGVKPSLPDSQRMTVTGIQETLKKIEAETGKRSAVIYTIVRTHQLELILVPALGRPLRYTVPAAKKEALMPVVQEFRSEITNPRRRRTKSYLKAAQQLYQWLITPLEKDLQSRGIDTFLLSLDPGLRSLPIAALHDGKRFLIETYNFSLIPSFSLTDTHYQPVTGSSVLAMGISEFIDHDPLPAVPVELQAITTDWPGKTFLNSNFTLENLNKQYAQRNFRLIHLATHAEFSPGHPSNSYIQLWNERLTYDRLELLKWNDPPVDLLVLSACKTALGDREAELGFAGLTVQSGAKAALASLWPVDDEGTLALMSEFYQQLRGVTIKAEGLRKAQLEMLTGKVRFVNNQLITSEGTFSLPKSLGDLHHQDFSHPYYWSAFTLIGNPW